MANQNTNPPGSSPSNSQSDSFGQNVSDTQKTPFGLSSSQSTSPNTSSPNKDWYTSSSTASPPSRPGPGSSSGSSSPNRSSTGYSTSSSAGSSASSGARSSAIDDEQEPHSSGGSDGASSSPFDFSDLQERATRSAKTVYDKVSGFVKENPRAAAGIGLAVGTLLLRRMTRR